MRFPRFFAKKRGDRRTGSEVWGSVGDALFHAVLVASGLAFGTLLVTGVAVPEWRINHDFLASRGVVVGKGLARRTVRDAAAAETSWQPALRLRYPTGDGRFEAAWALRGHRHAERARAVEQLATVALGDELPCWYDPARADHVVVERGYNWWMWTLTLLLPGALLAFGGAGLRRSLSRWGKSEERRAAPRGDGPLPSTELPGVPTCDDLNNSPGTVLRFRLPLESPENWTLLGFGLFAILWNVVLILLVVNAGLDLMQGEIDWLLASILLPFATIGVAGIVVFVRRLVFTTAVGPTQIEISDHPLHPGGTYEVMLAQGGTGEFRHITLSLELEERATFRQGTDSRTERIVVWRSELGTWQGPQVAPGTRFEVRAAIELPATAMHSFASEHNAVGWRVVVHGRPARWPAFMRSFPVIVHPAPPREAVS